MTILRIEKNETNYSLNFVDTKDEYASCTLSTGSLDQIETRALPRWVKYHPKAKIERVI